MPPPPREGPPPPPLAVLVVPSLTVCPPPPPPRRPLPPSPLPPEQTEKSSVQFCLANAGMAMAAIIAAITAIAINTESILLIEATSLPKGGTRQPRQPVLTP